MAGVKGKSGGPRPNSGRKTKAQEEHAATIIKTALKELYNTDSDETAVQKFLIEFAQTGRGQQFIAEHLLGKPKDTIDLNAQGNIQIVFERTYGEEKKE